MPASRGIAGDFRLDPVEQGGRDFLGDRDVLLDQVLRDERAGRPEGRADVRERHAVQVARRVVVVDDRVEAVVSESVCRPVFGWLSTITTASSGRQSTSSIGTRSRWRTSTIARFSARLMRPSRVMTCRLAESGFDQVGQPEHAAEAVRVRVDVRNEDDSFGFVNPIRKRSDLRSPADDRVQTFRVGAATRHVCSTSVSRSAASCGRLRRGAIPRPSRVPSRVGPGQANWPIAESLGGHPAPRYRCTRSAGCCQARAASDGDASVACKMEKPADKLRVLVTLSGFEPEF